MAVLTPLISGSLEEALLEVVERLSVLQEVSATTATPKSIISSYNLDGLTGAISIGLSMKARITLDSTGRPVITVPKVFD
jgi:hypothetical protein